MTNKKLKILFDLAEELYWEELKKSGISVLPCAWAKCGEKFLVISCFGKCSDELEKKIRETYWRDI